MALRNLKSWSQYSKRWQKARLKEGLSPRRWNRYRQLSERTRRNVDPYEYAKGRSVRQITRGQLLDQLVNRMYTMATTYTPISFPGKFNAAGVATLRRRLDALSTTQLRHYANIQSSAKLHGVVKARIQKQLDDEARALYYHSGEGV